MGENLQDIVVDPVPQVVQEARARLDELVSAMSETTDLRRIKELALKTKGLAKKLSIALNQDVPTLIAEGTGVEIKLPSVEAKPKRVKQQSRPQRWAAAVGDAQGGLETIQNAFGELTELQSEYQEWLDNLPENLQSGTLADKLQEITNLDFESDLSSVESTIGDAEGVELPLGFGRD